MYQDKKFAHNMLQYQTAQKPVALYDYSDLNTRKMKMFVNTLAKKTKWSIWHIWESHWNLYNQRESVSCIEVTKIAKKWLVLVILQGYQASLWVFI